MFAIGFGAMRSRWTCFGICGKPFWTTLAGWCVIGWACSICLVLSLHKPHMEQHKQDSNISTKMSNLSGPYTGAGEDIKLYSPSSRFRLTQTNNQTFSTGDNKNGAKIPFQPAKNKDERQQILQLKVKMNQPSRSWEGHGGTIPGFSSSIHNLTITALRPENPAFKAGLSKHEAEILYQILSTFDNVMKGANLKYFLCDGSLLGSYRHHGIIPWDEDADVCAMAKDGDKMIKLFKSLEPGMVLDRRKSWWKLFYQNSTPVVHNPYWNFPFLDIFLLWENVTHVWGTERHYNFKRCNSKCDVFPLMPRPLGPLMLPAPRNPMAVLQRTYVSFNMDLCISNSVNHRMGYRYEKPAIKQIPCRDFYECYPFVFREEKQNGTLEVLKIGNVTLNTIFISKGQ